MPHECEPIATRSTRDRYVCTCVELFKPAFLPTADELLRTSDDAATRDRRRRIHGFLVDEGVAVPVHAPHVTDEVRAEQHAAVTAAKERHREERRRRPLAWRREADAATSFVALLAETGERCCVERPASEGAARDLTLPSGWFMERGRSGSLTYCHVDGAGVVERFDSLSSVEAFILAHGRRKKEEEAAATPREPTGTTRSVVWTREDLAVFRAAMADRTEETDALSGRARALEQHIESLEEELERAEGALAAHAERIRALRNDLDQTKAALGVSARRHRDAETAREIAERQIRACVERAESEARRAADASAESMRLSGEVESLRGELQREKEKRRAVALEFDRALESERAVRAAAEAEWEKKVAAERARAQTLEAAVAQLRRHFETLPGKSHRKDAGNVEGRAVAGAPAPRVVEGLRLRKT